MIWLFWRRNRRAAVFALAGLAVLATFIVTTGLSMHRAYTQSGLDACLRGLGPVIDYRVAGSVDGLPDCNAPLDRFHAEVSTNLGAGALFLFLPLLVGMVIGAPLVAREVQHRTHHLVWTQGVTRRRWAWTTFGLAAAGSLILATGYTILVSWWVEPILQANAGRFDYLAFDLQGIVPVGYTLFAVALGIAAGALRPRVLAA